MSKSEFTGHLDPRRRLRDYDEPSETWAVIDELSSGAQDKIEDCVSQAIALICRGVGHYIIGDQCGKPEHDFCVYCCASHEEITKKQEKVAWDDRRGPKPPWEDCPCEYCVKKKKGKTGEAPEKGENA